MSLQATTICSCGRKKKGNDRFCCVPCVYTATEFALRRPSTLHNPHTLRCDMRSNIIPELIPNPQEDE